MVDVFVTCHLHMVILLSACFPPPSGDIWEIQHPGDRISSACPGKREEYVQKLMFCSLKMSKMHAKKRGAEIEQLSVICPSSLLLEKERN